MLLTNLILVKKYENKRNINIELAIVPRRDKKTSGIVQFTGAYILLIISYNHSSLLLTNLTLFIFRLC